MVVCNKCGAQLPDGTGFCGNCGSQLAAVQPTGNPSNSGRYRRSFAQPQAQNVPPQAQNIPPQAQQGQWQQQPRQNPYAQQGQWGQPPQQGQWGQPPMQQPSQAKQKAMAIWHRIISTNGPLDKKLLRITSIVFAVLLSFFLLGIGGDIYIGRLVDRANGKNTVTSSVRSYQKQKTIAYLKGDAKGYLNAENKMQVAELTSALGGSGYDTSDLTGAVSDTDVILYKQRLSKEASDNHKEYGFLWTNATYASHYIFQMIFYGILSALALAFWFWKGGRFSNIKETISLPWAPIALGVGILFFLHFCWFYPASLAFAAI